MKRMMQIGVALLVLILLAVTNPSREAHQTAIAEHFGKEHGVVGKMGGEIYSSLISYQSYVLFSFTEMDGKVRSIGFLGIVFTL